MGIEAIEPLWQLDPKKYLLEFINMVLEAIIVSSKADLFEKELKAEEEFHNQLEKLIESFY